MTEFTKRYQQLTDEELFDILANASSYQAIAVETAKAELLQRGISEDQLEELVLQNIEESKQKQQLLKQQKDAQKAEMKAFFDPINPFLKGITIHERQIRFLSWIFIGFAIYTVITDYSLMRFYIEDISNGEIGLYTIQYIFKLFAIVVGAILFWRRTKFGWILITFYVSGAISSFLISMIHTLTGPIHRFNRMVDDLMTAETSEVLFLILLLTSFAAVFYILFKRKVRTSFRIQRFDAILTLLIAITLQVALWIPILRHY